MGKMTRLKFLSISDNPFRAPLSNFFGQGALGREVSGVALADLVIKLLAEMSTEISESGDISQESFLHSRNSKVHYTEKSITGFEEETGDVSSNSSDSSNDLGFQYLHKIHIPSGKFPRQFYVNYHLC
ncbi:unnamed protein product [Orchesella dallaii]|uniref:Uncharacterized protein n=1 Tax=Orchesella dallaii TaxID=48710 RepID=A0ABP1QBY2_9HEXA